jgi:hypothetical protein
MGGPLEIAIAEEGWEEFPVTVAVASLSPETPTVLLDVGEDEWAAGDPRAVRTSPTSLALPDTNWIAGPHKTETWLLIPKRPGVLKSPDFQVGHRICGTVPRTVHIVACPCSPLVLL